MDHRRQLAVGLADADLELRLLDGHARGRRARGDPCDLEAEQLAAHGSVLDHDLEVVVDQERGELGR